FALESRSHRTKWSGSLFHARRANTTSAARPSVGHPPSRFREPLLSSRYESLVSRVASWQGPAVWCRNVVLIDDDWRQAMAQRMEIVLDDEQRQVLERWARRPKSSQALAFRCRAVLAAADGRSSKEIAAELGCNANTVSKWRVRFAER